MIKLPSIRMPSLPLTVARAVLQAVQHVLQGQGGDPAETPSDWPMVLGGPSSNLLMIYFSLLYLRYNTEISFQGWRYSTIFEHSMIGMLSNYACAGMSSPICVMTKLNLMFMHDFPGKRLILPWMVWLSGLSTRP